MCEMAWPFRIGRIWEGLRLRRTGSGWLLRSGAEAADLITAQLEGGAFPHIERHSRAVPSAESAE